MAEFASKGVAGAGLGLGIAGTALALLGGGLGGLGLGSNARSFVAGEVVGANAANNHGIYGCGTSYGMLGDSTPVNRYELGLEKELLEKDDLISELRAEKYADAAVVALGSKMEHKIDCLTNKFENKIDNLAAATTAKFGHVEHAISNQNIINAKLEGVIGCQAETIARLNGLTKTIIPTSSLCPEVMPRYNSFTVPTTTEE